MSEGFVTVRDLDNAQTTMNVKNIICLICPGPLSRNSENIVVFQGGTIKVGRDEAMRLQSILDPSVMKDLVH